MPRILITILVLAQAQVGNGVVMGNLRGADGKPVVGVRMALAEIPDGDKGAVSANSVLVSIATTDTAGAYRLENVPSGRYHLLAGRVDIPTYYPGTADPAQARVISISSGGLSPG